MSWQSSYEDPLRWKFPQSATEHSVSGEPRVDQVENDLCSIKALIMHRPTSDPSREASGRYPFSRHLSERRRLWEVRYQLRFKKLPERLFFGIELGSYTPVSGTARIVQKALVSACRKIVGECYHSPGDDPASTAGECELPTFVMPLWAFDQFEVSTPGSEPDLRGDFERVGMRRTDGVRQYIRAMNDTISNFSTDKVYTFCFWGVSQFLDVLNWEICGSMFPVRIDFNRLCGSPPVYITIYDMPGVGEKDADQRHLTSRKRHYLRVAAWSTKRPPKGGVLLEAPPAVQESDAIDDLPTEDLLKLTARLEDLPDLLSLDDEGTSSASKADSFDLLGLDFLGSAPPKKEDQADSKAGYSSSGVKAPVAETTDLLGLL